MSELISGPERIKAPFKWDQVLALRRWQEAGYVHELTCPNHHTLEVANAGLYCVECDYHQDWAPAICAGKLPPNPFKGLRHG